MYSQNINITHHRGLSLIELMVALVIVSILLLGVTTVYRASKRSYQLNDEVAEVQENARFVLQNMIKEIRMAGYTGCGSIREMTPNSINVISAAATIPPGFNTFGANNFILGHDDTNITWVGAGIARPAGLVPMVPGTDSITIRKTSACSDSLTRRAGRNANIQTTGECFARTGDVFIITDCQNYDMFTVSNINADGHLVHAVPENIPPPLLSNEYDTNSHILRPELINYFIGTNPNTGQPGLYQRRYLNSLGAINLNLAELVSNISNMRITYGIDVTGNGGVDVFLPANQVPGVALQTGEYGEPTDTPWARVVGINLSFTANSDPGAQGARGFNKIFTTAINLRNNTPTP